MVPVKPAPTCATCVTSVGAALAAIPPDWRQADHLDANRGWSLPHIRVLRDIRSS